MTRTTIRTCDNCGDSEGDDGRLREWLCVSGGIPWVSRDFCSSTCVAAFHAPRVVVPHGTVQIDLVEGVDEQALVIAREASETAEGRFGL